VEAYETYDKAVAKRENMRKNTVNKGNMRPKN